MLIVRRSKFVGYQIHRLLSLSMGDPKDFDLIVIGGGSGGLACAKEAASLGQNVAVLDYVTPSPKGNTWGLGGTCVNVGCIPKKFMHHVAGMREVLESASDAGWNGVRIESNKLNISWPTMSIRIQNYIKSLNWGHRVALRENNVKFINAKASFVDSNTIKAVDKQGQEARLKAKKFVIAVGGRPNYPNIPGAKEHGITSDDLFWLKESPGKTLVIGASYVALECAGFLNSFGLNTKIMMRSIPLRGFDRQMSDAVLSYMENISRIPILRDRVPVKVEKSSNNQLTVYWQQSSDKKLESEKFDSVLFATGRTSCTLDLNLDVTGVKLTPKGKVISASSTDKTADTEQTNAPHIYAIGDVLDGGVELTPVAIKAGKLLARRLYESSVSTHNNTMDYTNVATCVFTPLEYACIGLSEEDAITKIGGDHLEVYHCHYKPLEWQSYGLVNRGTGSDGWDGCYIKLICDLSQNEKVVGLHILGLHAGEILQGFAVPIKMGVTREQLCSNTVGIHPTSAEEIVKLHITKRSGKDPRLTGC